MKYDINQKWVSVEKKGTLLLNNNFLVQVSTFLNKGNSYIVFGYRESVRLMHYVPTHERREFIFKSGVFKGVF